MKANTKKTPVKAKASAVVTKEESKNSEQLTEYLKVIADSKRLQILCLLAKGERCVCDIHEPLGLPQNLVSHHLKALRDSKFVLTHRDGQRIIYRLNEERIMLMRELCAQLLLNSNSCT